MKTYGQLCPFARALDVLGDRWTLLVVRELLLGEKRFGEILKMLPAMGTNRLSDRLSMLCAHDVVQKSHGAAKHAGYSLTPLGEQLRQPVLQLTFWGMALTSFQSEDLSSARAELVALALCTAVDPSRLIGRQGLYAFTVGAEVFSIRISDGTARVRSGPCGDDADIALDCNLVSFLALMTGELPVSDAMAQGKILLRAGDIGAVEAVVDLLLYRPSQPSAA